MYLIRCSCCNRVKYIEDESHWHSEVRSSYRSLAIAYYMLPARINRDEPYLLLHVQKKEQTICLVRQVVWFPDRWPWFSTKCLRPDVDHLKRAVEAHAWYRKACLVRKDVMNDLRIGFGERKEARHYTSIVPRHGTYAVIHVNHGESSCVTNGQFKLLRDELMAYLDALGTK
jgi:hypothetical protein